MNNLTLKTNDKNLAVSTESDGAILNNNVEEIQPQLNNQVLKIVGEKKKFSPANKEWKNSTYAYNKNSVRSISILDKMAGKIIKGYFNLSDSKKLARSKRMRNLIRRSTIKKIFVSKPEIKQSAEKVMITVYTFDREKQFYIRKLYFYNKSLNLYNLWLNKTLSSTSLIGNSYRKNNSLLPVRHMSKRTSNPLYTNSMFGNAALFKKSNLTSRISQNKTYIHKLLVSQVSLKHHPFLHILRRRKKIQRKSNNLLYNNLHKGTALAGEQVSRKNYFSKLFGKKLGLGLRKTRLSLKHFIRKPLTDRKNRIYRNAYMARNSRGKRYTSIIKNSSRKDYSDKAKNSTSDKLGGAKIRIPYFNLKLKNEMKFLFFKLAYVKKFDYLRKLFFFSFLKYALSLFQTKVNIYNKSMHGSELILEFTVNNPDNSSKNSAAHFSAKVIKNYSNNKLKLIQRINMELLQLLDLTLASGKNNSSTKINKEKIYSLYEYFKANYFISFLRKYLKRELLASNYYTKFMINQYKFGKFLPGLKHILSNIYSKKVELNLVNLKYSHLNTDIYTDTIVTKLKRKVGLLKVLRRSLNLAKTPYKFFSVNNAANVNNFHTLATFKSLNVNGLPLNQNNGEIVKDKIDLVLNKLYPNSLAQSFNLKSFLTLANKKFDDLPLTGEYSDMIQQKKPGAYAKNVQILNQIRYKWVTGARLEAAGRLTRRYTAARSVFKVKYKGNLKNIDYSLKTDMSKKNISTVLLRNNVQPNLQYSFAKSKRRIGAFGLKGWINSY